METHANNNANKMKRTGREAHLKAVDSELQRNLMAPSLLSQKRKLLRHQWYTEVRGRGGAKSLFSCPSLPIACTIINRGSQSRARRRSPRMRRVGEPSLDCGDLLRHSWSSRFAITTRVTTSGTALNSEGALIWCPAKHSAPRKGGVHMGASSRWLSPPLPR